MTLQMAFFIAGIVTLVVGIVLGALAARSYVVLEIRAVKDDLSGAARMRSVSEGAKKPAGQTSKMRAFSQVGWKGKVRSRGEATTDSLTGKARKTGRFGQRKASSEQKPKEKKAVAGVSAEVQLGPFADDEPTSVGLASAGDFAGDEPTSLYEELAQPSSTDSHAGVAEVFADDEPTSVGLGDDEPTSVGLVDEATTLLHDDKPAVGNGTSFVAQRVERVSGKTSAVSDDDFRIVRKTIVLGSKEVLAD